MRTADNQSSISVLIVGFRKGGQRRRRQEQRRIRAAVPVVITPFIAPSTSPLSAAARAFSFG